MAKIENKTLKAMDIIAYPESCNIVEALETLKKNYVIEKLAYILHDKDVTEDGEIKKEHYHIYVSFKNKASVCAVATIFKTASNNVTAVRNFIGLIRYYRHLDNPEKYQYSKEELHLMNITHEEYENQCEARNTEESALQTLIEKITEDNVNLKQIMMFALKNGMYFVYRSNYAILRDIYKENKERENISKWEETKKEVEQLLNSRGQNGEFLEKINEPNPNDNPFI